MLNLCTEELWQAMYEKKKKKKKREKRITSRRCKIEWTQSNLYTPEIEAKQCISNLDAERFSRTEEVVVQLIIAI